MSSGCFGLVQAETKMTCAAMQPRRAHRCQHRSRIQVYTLITKNQTAALPGLTHHYPLRQCGPTREASKRKCRRHSLTASESRLMEYTLQLLFTLQMTGVSSGALSAVVTLPQHSGRDCTQARARERCSAGSLYSDLQQQAVNSKCCSSCPILCEPSC